MYTRQQIKEGLKNRFIQVRIFTKDDYENIGSLLKEMFPDSKSFPTVKPSQSIFIRCQIFEDGLLGWNGSTSQNIDKRKKDYFENSNSPKYTIINTDEINF